MRRFFSLRIHCEVENHAGYVASLHIRITVVCLHTLMLSTKRRTRAVLNVMCK